jgi:hypothetical protein
MGVSLSLSLSLSGLVLHAAWATNCNKLVGGLLDPMQMLGAGVGMEKKTVKKISIFLHSNLKFFSNKTISSCL